MNRRVRIARSLKPNSVMVAPPFNGGIQGPLVKYRYVLRGELTEIEEVLASSRTFFGLCVCTFGNARGRIRWALPPLPVIRPMNLRSEREWGCAGGRREVCCLPEAPPSQATVS